MGKSQKKRLLEAHERTMRTYKLIPYTKADFHGNPIQMLHIESR